MSFPRKVPVAQRKVNFKVRNKFLAGGMAYTVGMAAFAEYHGLFDSIRDLSSGEAQTLVQNVQLEDEKSWLRWSFKMMDKTAAKTKAVVEEQFLENLPTGVKHFLTDPRFSQEYRMNMNKPKDEEGSEKTIDFYDKAPGLSPTKVKLDDLIVFTSTKKTDNELPIET